jgi:hypothetical protein
VLAAGAVRFHRRRLMSLTGSPAVDLWREELILISLSIDFGV